MVVKSLSTALLIISGLLVGSSLAQAQTTTTSAPSTSIGNDGFQNSVIQANPQNTIGANQNQNTNNFVYPSIPLSPVIQNPINTENDFGLNLGGALNTLDGRNITLYLGITYQPGRTDDHNARMAKLKSETQLLEAQRQTTQTQLDFLKKQVTEQELRLKRLQSPAQTTPTPGQTTPR
jgi:hypothetical protein